MTNMPEDPFMAMAAAAVSLHELFKSYVAAGFTEPQAMTLVCAILSGAARGQSGA